MKKLLMTHEAKVLLCEKFNITPATCSEVINFRRISNMRHAEIRNYAIKHLNAAVYLD